MSTSFASTSTVTGVSSAVLALSSSAMGRSLTALTWTRTMVVL